MSHGTSETLDTRSDLLSKAAVTFGKIIANYSDFELRALSEGIDEGVRIAGKRQFRSWQGVADLRGIFLDASETARPVTEGLGELIGYIATTAEGEAK